MRELPLSYKTESTPWPRLKVSERVNRIIRVVFDADLRCSHDGLRLIAKKLHVSTDLKVGEYIVFINAKKSMLKIFAAGNTIAHFKCPDNRRMNLNVIAMIPTFFNGRELEYDKAIEALIKKEFHK